MGEYIPPIGEDLGHGLGSVVVEVGGPGPIFTQIMPVLFVVIWSLPLKDKTSGGESA
ncbi:hypothetical protein OCC_13715 [Thermococcus litoralis DSM 5473]|uniref:Uncharacterized protein n=2 Tax=Thermococcus TaxID=2263 RepID=S5ZAZ1_THELN|nr:MULTISPECIES: hypothetical protein [Thermococcus]AGT34233.1 hypothetical protein OCC_13715 [Thermococcus litoralis DSM 5473]ALV61840.1 hypothetical protein ADU37_CDS01410 [Thermococcus sp. 2319x1]